MTDRGELPAGAEPEATPPPDEGGVPSLVVTRPPTGSDEGGVPSLVVTRHSTGSMLKLMGSGDVADPVDLGDSGDSDGLGEPSPTSPVLCRPSDMHRALSDPTQAESGLSPLFPRKLSAREEAPSRSASLREAPPPFLRRGRTHSEEPAVAKSAPVSPNLQKKPKPIGLARMKSDLSSMGRRTGSADLLAGLGGTQMEVGRTACRLTFHFL